jgi:Type-F conjugative transfer system pilin assembly protein
MVNTPRALAHLAAFAVGLALIACTDAIARDARNEALDVLGVSQFIPQDKPTAPNVTAVVFVSTSIPVDRLARIMRSAHGRDDVLFIYRGWTPPSFEPIIQHLGGGVRAISGVDTTPSWLPSAQIDPLPYRAYNITSVPTFVVRCKDGEWRRAIGEASLTTAQEAACSQHGRVVGDVWPIKEPDILEVIERRAQAFDWGAAVQGSRDRADSGDTLTATSLPAHRGATVRRSFDPTVAVTRDIVNPTSGVMLARAGTRLNPLMMGLRPPTIIVWNPARPEEHAHVARWLSAHPRAVQLVTALPAAAALRLGGERYSLNEDMQHRLGVTHTPTLITTTLNAHSLTLESIDAISPPSRSIPPQPAAR